MLPRYTEYVYGQIREGQKTLSRVILDILKHWDKVDKVLLFPKDNPAKYKRYFYTLHSEASPVFDYFKSKSAPTENRVNWRERVIHETEYYKDIVRKIGWNKPFPKVNFPTTPAPLIVPENGKPILGICNGLFNTASWQKKSWPHFEKLCRLLKDKYHIVKIGFGKELDEVSTFDESFVNKLKITETASIISQCNKFITTDSSCMHIAAALGVDTVALFGGTYIFKNAPLSRNSFNLTPDFIESMTPRLSSRNRLSSHQAIFLNCRYYT